MKLVVKRNMEARNNYLLEKKETKQNKTRIEADQVPLTVPVKKYY